MKYIKTYEERMRDFIRNVKHALDNEKDLDKIDALISSIRNKFNYDIPLKSYQVYRTDDVGDFCYIGDNGEENFKNICLVLKPSHDGRFQIIVWNNWIKYVAKPLSINILDYAIKFDILDTLEKSLKRISFSEQPSNKVKKIVYNFRDNILNDDMFEIAKKANKYNL